MRHLPEKHLDARAGSSFPVTGSGEGRLQEVLESTKKRESGESGARALV